MMGPQGFFIYSRIREPQQEHMQMFGDQFSQQVNTGMQS